MIFFQQKNPRNVPLETQNTILTTLLKNFLVKVLKSQPEKGYEFFFFRNILSQGWSSGDAECNFDNPAKKFSCQSLKITARKRL